METRMNKCASKREAITKEIRRASKAQLLDFVTGKHDYSSYKHAKKR